MADTIVTIKKIRTAAGEHEIDARYLGGHTFEQIESMVHGGVETYVIPSSKQDAAGYKNIVNSAESTLTTTKTILDGLTNGQANGGYKLGDIILMEATSDGEKVFDRWVSAVDGENITLAVLETQVAKHHHTINPTTDSVYVDHTPTYTTNAIPTVGAPVKVLAGKNANLTVLTSVEYDENGGHDLKLSSDSGDGSVSHSHSIESHNHTISFKPIDLVKETAEVYGTLTKGTYVPFEASTIDVAGGPTEDTTLTYATGNGDKDTFVKNLKDVDATTGGQQLTTGTNADGLTTSAQTSKDSVGDEVKTTSASAHTHTVNAVTTSDVVTSVTLADTVLTEVKYTPPTVQGTVVTEVTSTDVDVISSITPKQSSVITSAEWKCEVDDAGVLSFDWSKSTGSAVASVEKETTTVSSKVAGTKLSQSAGSLTTTDFDQTHTSGKVTSTATTSANGEHTHGFSHTHAIPSHTHTITAHTHTYKKSAINETGDAYTGLTTKSYTPHTHENVSVVESVVDGNSAFEYYYGGSKTSVVKDLKDTEHTYTSTSKGLTTDTKYVKLSGKIEFPGLITTPTTLSTTTITPAVAGNEKPIASIKFIPDTFVKSVDITSVNIGGEPK